MIVKYYVLEILKNLPSENAGRYLFDLSLSVYVSVC